MFIRRPATMHPRNNRFLIAVLFAALVLPATLAFAQQDQVTPEELEHLPRATTSTMDTAPPPAPGSRTTTQPQPGTTQQQPGATRGSSGQVEQRGDTYLIRKEVQEVQLY